MKDGEIISTVWLSPIESARDYDVQFRDDHVRVTIQKGAKLDRQKQFDYWNMLRDVCEKNNTRRVLVEGTVPEGERQATDVMDAGRRTATVPHLWLAYCLRDWVSTPQSELYETIAASQGVRVKFFTNREHALKWLRSNAPS